MDSRRRSLAKTVTWRVVATLGTVILVFILTGKLILAFGFGVVDGVFKTALYYLHERAWDGIRWGKG